MTHRRGPVRQIADVTQYHILFSQRVHIVNLEIQTYRALKFVSGHYINCGSLMLLQMEWMDAKLLRLTYSCRAVSLDI